jgi:putative spermidine/putrescine transport system permease protein
MRDRLAPAGKSDVAQWGWLLVPAAAVLMLVFILPMCGITLISLHPAAGKAQVGSSFTLHNYVEFLSDPFYRGILLKSIQLGAIATVTTLVLAYPTAYFMARTRSRFIGILNFLIFAPLLVSILIRNLGWLPLLSQDGFINSALLGIGIIQSPIKLANSFTGVAIGLVHALLPYMILTLAGVIRSIAAELEEASISLGAGPIETFFRVVLPLSRPGVVSGSLLVFTLAVGAFTTPVIMGGNRVLVMPTYISQQMHTLLNYPRGAAAAIVLLVFAGVLTGLSLWVGERKERRS